MNRDEATETLREVERLEGLTTARMRGFWQPFVLWGVLALASVPFSALQGPGLGIRASERLDDAAGWYWAVALPAGVLTSILLYRRRDVRPRRLSPWAIVIGILVLFLMPFGMLAMVESVAADETGVRMLAIAAVANIVYGIATGMRRFAWISALLFLLTGFSIFVTSHRGIVVSSGFAGAYLLAGWVTKTRESR